MGRLASALFSTLCYYTDILYIVVMFIFTGEAMIEKQIPMTEEELADVAACFAQAKGWDLYPEVVLPNFGGRPDHIGLKSQELVAAFEYKRSLTYPVIEQLTRWHHEMARAINSPHTDERHKGIPHLLIAVCQKPNSRQQFTDLKRALLTQYRLGYYEISKVKGFRDGRRATAELKDREVFTELGSLKLWIGDNEYQFYEEISPKIQAGSRRTAHNIIKHLNEDMKMGVAGLTGQADTYMTPFKRSMEKVRQVLERGGEWHVNKIIDCINSEMGGHHWGNDKSAKTGICNFIEKRGIAERARSYGPVYRLKPPKGAV